MGCVPAALCRKALYDATESFPTRSRSSDGICGDAAHQARKSDHNSGNAFDLTHDPKTGCDAHGFAEQIRIQNPPWVKYIISKGRIWSRGDSGWRRYTGPNPHNVHAHFSINTGYRDVLVDFPWTPGAATKPPPPPIRETDNMQLIPKYAGDGALHYFYVADGGDLYHAWWPRSEPYGRKDENLGARFKLANFDGQPSVTAEGTRIDLICDRTGSNPPSHFFYDGKAWGSD